MKRIKSAVFLNRENLRVALNPEGEKAILFIGAVGESDSLGGSKGLNDFPLCNATILNVIALVAITTEKHR